MDLQPLQEEIQARRLEIESANQELRALNQQMQHIRERVRQRGDFVAAIVDAISVPTLVLKRRLEVSEANRAFYRAYHARPLTTLRRPLARVEGAEWDEPLLTRALERVFDDEEPLALLEFDLRIPPDELRILAASANPVTTPDGPMVVCCLDDITARKRAQQLLLTRLEVLGTASAALVLLDTNQRILYANPALEAITGFSAVELQGEHIHQKLHTLMSGDVRNRRAECPIVAALRARHAASGEETFRRKSGEFFPVRWQTRPLHTSGPDGPAGPGAGVLELHDISGERRVLDSLLSSEKQASAGRLAATIAHEINNPLGAIGNALYAIGTKLRHEPPELERVGALAAIAQGEVRRISHIVQSTLGMYRDQEPVEVDVNLVCNNVLELLDGQLRSKRVQVRRRLQSTLPVRVRAGDLRQMVANLVGNAVEAVAPGGSICLASYDSGGRVRVLVGDNGPGIPSEMRGRIFEPFVTSKSGRGTGLGLWVTAELVRANHGCLRMKSCTSAPSGTWFALSFDAAAA